ncbi:NAD(P)/FAD-dependent oxidoreductase [Microbacterium sp. P06]|uniref:NAD(P)/FAD-dependent oxidoreductase n=1 Tax=Microbacterium sp. P06 TaxID=3366949 RepID=UPI00374735E0
MQPAPVTHSLPVVVIGGGNAGLSVAGRLRRQGVGEIVVIEPREQHVYAPLQSHIAGGLARASEAVRPQADVIPPGVEWIRDRVTSVDPHESTVTLSSGVAVQYGQLIVAAGIELRWDAVPGLAEAMHTPRGISSYTHALAAKASVALRDIREGTVVFVQPPEPATCAGVAQKPMYLANDWWRHDPSRHVRSVFVSPEPRAFQIDDISAELQRKIDEYGIETRYAHDVIEVHPESQEVVIGRGSARETMRYDLLHAIPPQAAAGWIAESGLGDADGFVDVDERMLRHRRFGNVWALGDATAVAPTRSGGGIRPQAKVLVKNLMSVMKGQEPRAAYDGYTVTPITVSRHTLVFGEFDREGHLAPTVPFWATLFRERRLTYVLDRWVLPWVYWNLILRGRD